MSGELLNSGLALLKRATALDAAGDVQAAISHYLLALEVLVKVHGYEKIDTNKQLLKDKIELYMARVEQLRGMAPGSTAASSKPVASAPPSDDALPSLPHVPTGAPGARPPSPGRAPLLVEKTVALKLDSTGFTYRSLFGDYLKGAVRVVVEDPYLKSPHQLRNLLRLLELVAETNDAYEVEVVTRPDNDEQQHAALQEMQRSLHETAGIKMTWKFSDSLHDRCLRLSNGWRIVLGRGLDIWQKPSNPGKYFLGASEMALRKTLECDVIYLRDTQKP